MVDRELRSTYLDLDLEREEVLLDLDLDLDLDPLDDLELDLERDLPLLSEFPSLATSGSFSFVLHRWKKDT